MSDNVKVVLNSAGVRELLKSDWIIGICQEQADAMARRAGSGYETSAYTGRNRVNVSVFPKSKTAERKNLKNNTLLKAMGG